MKKIVAGIVGLACLSAPARAVAPAYGEVNDNRRVENIVEGARATRVVYFRSKKDWKPSRPIKWISIVGGEFKMATDEKTYSIKTFDMTETLVTVEQYEECVNTTNPATGKAWCTEPDTREYCNWHKADRLLHPVNCVSFAQVNMYARFKDARLPSETEYEYAATNGGTTLYPWGNERATCKFAWVSGDEAYDYGCGKGRTTAPVCSIPAGNTLDGLCDMVGNVWEFTQDKQQLGITNRPLNGSAFEGEGFGSYRVVRGGSFYEEDIGILPAVPRGFGASAFLFPDRGFRIARSSR